MRKLELGPDGYVRIDEKIQAATNAVNAGILNPDMANRFLWKAHCALHELRQTLRDVCLLVPDAAGPEGPDAA
jgi:hypothetical protein